MNCRKARRRASLSARSAVPADAARHIESCRACRAWVESDARLRALLRWKRNEQPDPFLATRLSARVRAAVAETAQARGFRWSELFPTFSLPIARYGLAAVFIGMVTFQFLAEPQRPPPDAAAPPAFALGGVGPSSSLSYRSWEAGRPLGPSQRPPWLDYAPLSVTNMASAGIQPGFGFRHWDEEP